MATRRLKHPQHAPEDYLPRALSDLGRSAIRADDDGLFRQVVEQAGHRLAVGLPSRVRLNTMLHWAAERGQIDRVRTLMRAGMEVNRLNGHGCLPLHLAVHCQFSLVQAHPGYLQVVIDLLNAGSDVTQRSYAHQTGFDRERLNERETVLMSAERAHRAGFDNAHVLDVLHQFLEGRTIQAPVPTSGALPPLLPFMLEHSPDERLRIAICSEDPLSVASTLASLAPDSVTDLLNRPFDESGWTALSLAGHLGHMGIAQQLLAAGASIDAVDTRGFTALGRTLLMAYAPWQVDQRFRRLADFFQMVGAQETLAFGGPSTRDVLLWCDQTWRCNHGLSSRLFSQGPSPGCDGLDVWRVEHYASKAFDDPFSELVSDSDPYNLSVDHDEAPDDGIRYQLVVSSDGTPCSPYIPLTIPPDEELFSLFFDQDDDPQ